VLKTYLRYFEGVVLSEIFFDEKGTLNLNALKEKLSAGVSCFVLSQPNFFGGLEDADAISSLVHEAGALLVALVNPLSLGVLKAPGSYQADFAVAEGQVLGNPMNFGGPGLGIMAAKKAYMRQLPGRIVGIAQDKNGERAFVLTLQAREQHIRREKAASNICSNEALCALNAVIYLTLLGPKGLKEVAELNLERSHRLAEMISQVSGYRVKFSAPFFNEFVLECPKPAQEIVDKMAEKGIGAGFALGKDYPDMKNCMLVCATEMRTEEDLKAYGTALGGI
jgi:glycine dehydrogenase subunit 1